jgi:HEPN domain-containing protein
MKEEAKKWLDKALSDLDVAKDMFKLKKYEYAAFWCQQAVEKALKALQIEKESRFDKVHDLVMLSEKINAPHEVKNICKKLTSAYTYARYPDVQSDKEDMKGISQDFIKGAEKVISWIRKNL